MATSLDFQGAALQGFLTETSDETLQGGFAFIMSSLIIARGDRDRDALLTMVESLNKEDAKLFGEIVKAVGPLTEWPPQHLRNMFVTHLTHVPRSSLTIFLLKNKCPDDLVNKWVVGRKMLRDQEAYNHVNGIIKRHKTGKLTEFDTHMLHAGNFNFQRFPYDEMTNAEAKTNGFTYNAFLRIWQKLIITGPTTLQKLLQEGAVYTDFHNGMCRAWTSSFFIDEHTRSVIAECMEQIGFVFQRDILKDIDDNLHLATLRAMSCSRPGYMKKMTRAEYNHLSDDDKCPMTILEFSEQTIQKKKKQKLVPPREEDGEPQAIHFSGPEDAPTLTSTVLASDGVGISDLF